DALPSCLAGGLLPGVLAVLLSACTTVSLDEAEPGKPPAADVDILTQPLKVPPLEALRDTPERKLQAKFVPVGWAALPSWSDDDFSQIWPVFIDNCQGLMRPTGGSMVQQARATPKPGSQSARQPRRFSRRVAHRCGPLSSSTCSPGGCWMKVASRLAIP